MAERVDKQWQKKGLGGYEIEAILGTLRHYGVTTDEAAFGSEATESYPLKIGRAWSKKWTGKGQFLPFPQAAADELWRRWQPDRLAPFELADALVYLIHALKQMLDNQPTAPVGLALDAIAGLRRRVPLEEGRPSARFMEELTSRLGEAGQTLRELPPILAKEGHLEDADATAELSMFLFPESSELMKVLISAAKGHFEEAESTLGAFSAGLPSDAGPGVLDALIQVDALSLAQRHAVVLLDRAEQDRDFHVALEIGERLAFLLDQAGEGEALQALNQRLERVHQAHATDHPHH